MRLDTTEVLSNVSIGNQLGSLIEGGGMSTINPLTWLGART